MLACDLLGLRRGRPGHIAGGGVSIPPSVRYVWRLGSAGTRRVCQENTSRLGRIEGVHPTVPRPLSVRLMEVVGSPQSLTRARFRPALDPESGEPLMAQLTIQQVRLQVKVLSARNYPECVCVLCVRACVRARVCVLCVRVTCVCIYVRMCALCVCAARPTRAVWPRFR